MQPSIPKLKEELLKFKTARDELAALSTDTVNFTFFQIQCSKLKEEVRGKINKGTQALLDRIAKFCEEEVNGIQKEYDFILEKVRTVPTNEDELFELKQFTKSVKAKSADLLKKEISVQKHIEILEDYQMLNEDINGKLWSCKMYPWYMNDELRKGIDRLAVDEEKFREKLEKEKDIWFRETIILQQSFDLIQQFSDYSNSEYNCGEVKNLDEKLQQAMDKMISFNNRETLFELPLSDKSELQKMIDEFEPYNTLWKNADDFQKNYLLWMNDKKIMELKDLNPDPVKMVDKWMRECFFLSKKLMDKSPEAINVITHLKDQLSDFQENIPLIKAISNEAWTEDHWNRLAVVGGLDPNLLDPKTETLGTLITKGMKDFIEQIEDISYKAQREYKLKKKLDEMKKEYENLQLEVLPYKDTYVIKTVEDIQGVIDEQIVSVQSMKTSPYAKPIEDLCKN